MGPRAIQVDKDDGGEYLANAAGVFFQWDGNVTFSRLDYHCL